MSIQYGNWKSNGRLAGQADVAKISGLLARLGLVVGSTYQSGTMTMISRSAERFTTSAKQDIPVLFDSDNALFWTGRLDNRIELLSEVGEPSRGQSEDSTTAAAAYARWGNRCFAKFVGEWTVAVWNPVCRSLVLARDFAGVLPLYYAVEEEEVSWCNALEPLICRHKTLKLHEEYLAGWLASFPATHLTPYSNIHSVPASSYVEITPHRQSAVKYWDFDPKHLIRYHSDNEYEEHFRTLFFQSVKRRLRSRGPLLAELSGGLDSTSIVCVADTLLRKEEGEVSRLDTLSYYNDKEPHWDERPYFEIVEKTRGRTGFHIEMDWSTLFQMDVSDDDFCPVPALLATPQPVEAQLSRLVASQDYRVVLSGLGGDEVLGGVPTPIPELADLLAGSRLIELAHKLKAWSLAVRKPWFRLFTEALRAFLPSVLSARKPGLLYGNWLDAAFLKRRRRAFQGYAERLRFFGPRPSFMENLNALETVKRQIGCFTTIGATSYVKSYPYLDRDLLEFLFAIPREQLVRPGQRRSLMRRALAGIVPQALLERKRKGFISRSPFLAITAAWERLRAVTADMHIASLGLVNSSVLVSVLEKARCGEELPAPPLMRTLILEYWLSHLAQKGLFTAPIHSGMRQSTASEPLHLRSAE